MGILNFFEPFEIFQPLTQCPDVEEVEEVQDSILGWCGTWPDPLVPVSTTRFKKFPEVIMRVGKARSSQGRGALAG